METINHECYVSLEVAKLLKEADFDWETFGYNNKLGFFHRAIPHHGETSAPTLDMAQKWLREVKNANIEISYDKERMWNVIDIFDIDKEVTFDNYYYEKYFDTYEEAQEAGIKKALEIILEKGE
jgi:hypothetical protein